MFLQVNTSKQASKPCVIPPQLLILSSQAIIYQFPLAHCLPEIDNIIISHDLSREIQTA